MKRIIRVADGFYPDPDAIRRRALKMTYVEPENLVGWRTRAYQPVGIKRRIEQRFGVSIPHWERDPDAIEACNGVFFTSYATGPRGETVGIHYDTPPTWVMFLIYLTPGAPSDAGTSLWQHRKTGLVSKPTARDAQQLATTVEKLDALLERDARIRSRWIEIDRIGNVFNRAVMFPGGFFHSASRHFGRTIDDGRIYQSFHFPVKFL
ncbi:MAG TPA: DUF6445 family protein [Thermoanaerobaculia bacterium]|nr:DUF6445 family protein [Thermoanaerobaculia bacterium]